MYMYFRCFFQKDNMHVSVQIWCTVISTLMHTVDNTNKYVDDMYSNIGHLIWLHGCKSMNHSTLWNRDS